MGCGRTGDNGRGTAGRWARRLGAGVAAALVVASLGAVDGHARPRTGRAGAVEWVALGDAYTAGGSEVAGAFERPDDGCGRTDHSYPRLLAGRLPAVHLRDVSCVGATIDDVYRTSQTPTGYGTPFGVAHHTARPAVRPQLAAVSRKTDVVSVEAGADTLGLHDLLLTCVRLGGAGGTTPCRAGDAAARRPVAARLRDTAAGYAAMLAALRSAAPRAQLLAVGYPTLVPDDTAKCGPGGLSRFGAITAGDLAWLRDEVLKPLNTTIRRAAEAAGATYVDLEASTVGHDVCAGDLAWAEGLASTSVPGRWAHFLPNVAGHANAANQVQTAMGALTGAPDPR
ncbi:SGNH/GDSL hydrolase family protein [Streptomyces sp. NPDC059740]|uniref:SGNH/GDSL hydrolase family protein n=1 Tax=Streptomyces sp. NPDC059740 TaxID=3346926 RepID=UPI00365ACE20